MENNVTFTFSGALLRFVDFAQEIEVPAPNLELALQELQGKYPSLKSALFDGEGKVRRSHQMFLNGEQIMARYYSDHNARRELTLQPGDSVYVLTAIAGG